MKQFLSEALVVMLMLPGLALAHPGHSETTGIMHELSHLMNDADYLLAMIVVGLLAAYIGGRALWRSSRWQYQPGNPQK